METRQLFLTAWISILRKSTWRPATARQEIPVSFTRSAQAHSKLTLHSTCFPCHPPLHPRPPEPPAGPLRVLSLARLLWRHSPRRASPRHPPPIAIHVWDSTAIWDIGPSTYLTYVKISNICQNILHMFCIFTYLFSNICQNIQKDIFQTYVYIILSYLKTYIIRYVLFLRYVT